MTKYCGYILQREPACNRSSANVSRNRWGWLFDIFAFVDKSAVLARQTPVTLFFISSLANGRVAFDYKLGKSSSTAGFSETIFAEARTSRHPEDVLALFKPREAVIELPNDYPNCDV